MAMDPTLLALLGGDSADPMGGGLTLQSLQQAMADDEEERKSRYFTNLGFGLMSAQGGNLLSGLGQAGMFANQQAEKDEGRSVKKLLTTAQLQSTLSDQADKRFSRQSLRAALEKDPSLSPEQRVAMLANPTLAGEYMKSKMVPELTDDQREYEAWLKSGNKGSFIDFKGEVAKATRAPREPTSRFDFTPFGRGDKVTGELSPYGPGVGPFHGEGTPQQAMNVVIGYGVKKRANQPTTPEEDFAYAAAHSALSKAQRYTTFDAQGNQITVEQPAMDLSLFPKPAIAGAPGAAAPDAAAPAPPAQPPSAEPAAPMETGVPGGRPGAQVVGTKPAQLTAPEQKEAMDAAQRVKSAKIAVPLLQRAIELNKTAASGYGARGEQVFDTMFNPKEAADTAEFENIILRQVAESMRAAVGANPTEGERQFLVDIQGALNMPREQRSRLLKNGLSLMQQRMNADNEMLGSIKSGGFRFYDEPGAAPASPMGDDPLGLKQ